MSPSISSSTSWDTFSDISTWPDSHHASLSNQMVHNLLPYFDNLCYHEHLGSALNFGWQSTNDLNRHTPHLAEVSHNSSTAHDLLRQPVFETRNESLSNARLLLSVTAGQASTNQTCNLPSEPVCSLSSAKSRTGTAKSGRSDATTRGKTKHLVRKRDRARLSCPLCPGSKVNRCGFRGSSELDRHITAVHKRAQSCRCVDPEASLGRNRLRGCRKCDAGTVYKRIDNAVAHLNRCDGVGMAKRAGGHGGGGRRGKGMAAGDGARKKNLGQFKDWLQFLSVEERELLNRGVSESAGLEDVPAGPDKNVAFTGLTGVGPVLEREAGNAPAQHMQDWEQLAIGVFSDDASSDLWLSPEAASNSASGNLGAHWVQSHVDEIEWQQDEIHQRANGFLASKSDAASMSDFWASFDGFGYQQTTGRNTTVFGLDLPETVSSAATTHQRWN